MTITASPASVVPARLPVSFKLSFDGAVSFDVTEGDKAYSGAIMNGRIRILFIEINGMQGHRFNTVQDRHKLGLRMQILAAFDAWTREGVDTGIQHDAHVQAGVASYAAFWEADAREAERALPAPKARRVVTRGLQSIALALSLASSLPAHAGDMLPFPASHAELHIAAKLEMPADSDTVRGRVAAFMRGMQYEGRGEWNCAPKRCQALLTRYRLTWRQVNDTWTGRAAFRSAVPVIAANDKGMRAP